MKKKVYNDVYLEGLVYEHKLEKKTSGPTSKNPGTEFINGTLSIATDDACLNVVQVHFTYVTATTSKGNPNTTFTALNTIMNGKTVVNDGQQNALKVRVNTSIGLNEWYRDIKDEEPQMIVRNEGGFVHIINGQLNEDENSRNRWEADMVITKITEVEANPERGTEAEVRVGGLIFNSYTKAVFPMTFSGLSKAAIDYFSKLDVSAKSPIFTRLWGRQLSQTVKREIVEEGAFGDPTVRIENSSVKKYVIMNMSKEAYPWGDSEEGISIDEMKEKMADREVYLASVRKRQEDYQNSKNAAKPAASAATGDYDF